jgi:hypothetical protein
MPNDTIAAAQEALCAAHKLLDDAVRYRDQPALQAKVLRAVAGSLDHLAGDLMAETGRLAPRWADANCQVSLDSCRLSDAGRGTASA